MRILLVAGRFARPGDSAWLLDDLSSELVEAGVSVTVVVGDNSRPPTTGGRNRSDMAVVDVSPMRAPGSTIAKLISYLSTGQRIRNACSRLLRTNRYDLVITTSIALTSLGAGRLAHKFGARSAFVMWDFFPVHHAEIGRIPSGPWLPVLKALERWAIGRPDTVVVMSPKNEQFFRRYHPGVGKGYAIQPPWAADLSEQERRGVVGGRDRMRTVIFGGQLAAGRGVSELLDCAEIISRVDPSINFEILGDGPLREQFVNRIELAGATNVKFLGMLPREEYIDRISSCLIGVAVTVAGVSVPTFPSKICDYAKVGLPILVAAEAGSDVGATVESAGAGVSVNAGDVQAMADAILKIANGGETAYDGYSAGSRALYEAKLSARAAAETFISCART